MSEQLTTEHETDHEGGAMSTTTGKTLPRYDFRGRRPDARGLVEPLAPLLTEKLTDAPELTQHRELVGHFQAAQAKAIELAAELEIAKREDEERRRAALTKGRKAPAPKAAGVEVQLEEARKDTEMLGQVVVESASKLLAAAMPHLAEADDESSAVVESALDETGSLIDAALAALDRSETAAGQSGWLAQLHQQGVVSPGAKGSGPCPPPPCASSSARRRRRWTTTGARARTGASGWSGSEPRRWRTCRPGRRSGPLARPSASASRGRPRRSSDEPRQGKRPAATGRFREPSASIVSPLRVVLGVPAAGEGTRP